MEHKFLYVYSSEPHPEINTPVKVFYHQLDQGELEYMGLLHQPGKVYEHLIPIETIFRDRSVYDENLATQNGRDWPRLSWFRYYPELPLKVDQVFRIAELRLPFEFNPKDFQSYII